MMTPALSDVVTSPNRALWGEVSPNLRSAQFTVEPRHIGLRFYFDGTPNDEAVESVGSIGAEVAADFPGCKVSEEVIPTTAGTAIPRQEGWHLAFARKEASLVA
jgi:hypothetical protein